MTRDRQDNMHRSKLCGFIIDCRTDDLEAAAGFWSGALGMAVKHLPGEEGTKYVRLLDPHDQLHIEVQKVDHDSRVHLDIETDDVEAEVAGLQRLGATKLHYCQSWCVMAAPTGQRFCVVRKSSSQFEEQANRWE